MNAIVFGGTGMVGQGLLRECLLDPDVERVLSIVRTPSGQRHPKLRELVHANFLDFSPIESQLSGFDAAFFCLGVTSAGKTEEQYSRVTYDIGHASKAKPRMRYFACRSKARTCFGRQSFKRCTESSRERRSIASPT